MNVPSDKSVSIEVETVTPLETSGSTQFITLMQHAKTLHTAAKSTDLSALEAIGVAGEASQAFSAAAAYAGDPIEMFTALQAAGRACAFLGALLVQNATSAGDPRRARQAAADVFDLAILKFAGAGRISLNSDLADDMRGAEAGVRILMEKLVSPPDFQDEWVRNWTGTAGKSISATLPRLKANLLACAINSDIG